MARVVETAVAEFKDQVKVDKVVTRTRDGALRYREIVAGIGRQVAVPSILINGRPVFEKTPGVEALQQVLRSMVT